MNKNIINAETTTVSIEEMLSALNTEQDKNKHTPMIKALEEALKEDNKQRIKDEAKRFAKLYTSDSKQFWAEFVADPFAEVRRLKKNDEGVYELAFGKRRVLFTQIDGVYQDTNGGNTIAQSKNYVRMIARLTDNLYRAKCKNLSEGVDKDAKVVINAAYNGEKGDAKMKEINFSGTSIGNMLEQMQAVVDTIMPKEESVRLSRADVRYVQDAMTNANEGTVKTGNEKKLEAAIWVAVGKRKAGKAYEVNSMAKCHKQKKQTNPDGRTEKQEEVMSKVPNRPEAETCNNPKPEKKSA